MGGIFSIVAYLSVAYIATDQGVRMLSYIDPDIKTLE